MLGGHGTYGGQGQPVPSGGAGLRKAAYQILAYNERTGQSMLVLPNTPESDSGEAAVGQSEGTFTDPDSTDEDVNVRYFAVGREDW